MVKKIVSIVLIFAVTSIAWMILGATIQGRTYSQTGKLAEKVEGLWGSAHVQAAPAFYYETKRERKIQKSDTDDDGGSNSRRVKKTETIIETVANKVNLNAGDVSVDFDLTHRKKGLLWYDTYRVNFLAKYKVRNTLPHRENFKIDFVFPARDAIYDNFRLTVNGKPVDVNDFSKGNITLPVNLDRDEEAVVEVGYLSQGLDKWFYKFGDNVSRVKNFSLTMTTNFSDIDFPQNTISPTTKEKTPSGWKLNWRYSDLISGFQIGMDMPNKLNPGPLASQISYFAPVSLLFFFFVVFMISELKNIKIHPVNYLFLAAAFFAFHLLFSYTVDHLNIYLAFLISSIVALFLVISYMRLVVNARFAAVEVGISQLIFLVLFSLAHFFEGYTGLTVTIGAILTLWVMMQMTAKINWEKKFKGA